MKLDLVIRGGTVVDGSGGPARRADVGVSGDRIVAIGEVAGDSATRTIEADGCVVTPGFIDGHTHMDAQVMWDPLGRPSCWHGVTTILMGNCGFTLAPSAADRRDLVVRNLERAEDIPAEALALGIEWGWERFSDYLVALSERSFGPNVGVSIGHSALRTWVMADDAFERPATEAEEAVMERELDDALGAGAIGFTTSRSENHLTSDDRPVASRLASWGELRRLLETVARHRDAVFEIANEGAIRSADPGERARACGRLEALLEGLRVPFTFGVLPTLADGADWRDQLALVERLRAEGLSAFAQSHSRGVSVVLSFLTQLPFDSLPSWASLKAQPLEVRAAWLRDPERRAELVRAAHELTFNGAVGAEARPPDFRRLFVFDSPMPPHRSLQEVADERGIDPVEAMIELALDSGMRQLFLQPLGPSDDAALYEIMRHPDAVMTFSDAGAHVSQIMDASIHTHLLGYWVRQLERIPLENAVRMITADVARAWGLRDRGLVKEGYVADLNVFDPHTVTPAMPIVVHDLPGGAPRLEQRSIGFRATTVGGTVLVADGVATGDLPGRLLRRGLDA